ALDVGDVFINSSHTYLVTLDNVGAIPARWRTERSMTPLGQRFSFSPTSGVLSAGESVTMELTFFPHELGALSEVFKVAVVGAPEPLTLHVRGRVIGPK